MTDDRKTVLGMTMGLNGPLLNDEAIAETFAALLLKRVYGEAELARQRPLRVTDQATDWLVEGSYQGPDPFSGMGAWYIKFRKSDCRVEGYGFHAPPMELPDEVKEAIAQVRKSRKPG